MAVERSFSNKRTHKTDALLKLLTNGSLNGNPFLNEKFKDDIILTAENPPAPRKFTPGEIVDADIIAELAEEFLPLAIERFGCCKCKRCYDSMLSNIIHKCPRALVKIRNRDDFRRAEYLKRHHRNTVLRIVVHEAIAYRNRKKHITPRA
jgi:hypothetical protein